MSRHYYLNDAQGQRKLSESELPLRIGGSKAGTIVLPGLNEDQLLAYIALENGHAYVQPIGEQALAGPVEIFLNDEQITQSSWLKSGDRIQIAEHQLNWTVKGDKVVIELVQTGDHHALHPPQEAPPSEGTSVNNELPVNTQQSSTRHTGSTTRKIILGVIGLLLIAAIYLIMLIPLTLEIEPKADEMALTGSPPPLELWGSHLVMPGHYTLRAQRQGYVPLSQEIEINRNSNTTLQLTLEELPGLLLIKTRPEVEYTLFVDDQETPLDEQGQAHIERGSHNIRLQTARYLPLEQMLEIDGYGQVQEQLAELQPAWATVSLSSHPEGAEVYLDGEKIGLTPLDTEVLQGKHAIEFHLKDYKPFTLNQDITAGEDMVLEPVQLQLVNGELTINSQPSGASITLDGNYIGTSPLTLAVTAGNKHELKLSMAGFRTATQQARLQANEELTLDIQLSPVYGTVFLNTRPVDAQVMIDGKPVKPQGGRLRLSVRPHKLTVSKSGYLSQSQTVTPHSNISQHIEVSLKPVQQAATAEKKERASPTSIKTKQGQGLRLIQPQSQLIMGASRREAGRRANENRRLVKLERPFYFSQRETSNGEYRQFQAAHDSGSVDGAGLNGDMQPVVNISWEDAARYCNWLSQQHGLPTAYQEVNGKMTTSRPLNTGYRLPTEAEWAWVARRHDQKTEQRYPWQGSYPPSQIVGNFADAQIADTLADVVPGYDDGYRGTAPAGQFAERPTGFFDLGGNVAEWVNDYYTLYPGQSMQEVVDPLGPTTGTHHTIRGSGWRHGNITELRLSFRDYSNKPRYDLGFRVARYAD